MNFKGHFQFFPAILLCILYHTSQAQLLIPVGDKLPKEQFEKLKKVTSPDNTSQAQLRVGDKLPKEQFEKLKKVTSPDFPYKSDHVFLYILDFWNLHCGACIASFPKMEGLQYQFRNKVKIIAVNPWETGEELTSYFSRFEKKNVSARGAYRMATLPAINGDKHWLDLFPTQTVPHHVWLDREGQVIAITQSYNATEENIDYYIKTGKLPKMLLKPEFNQFDLTEVSLDSLWGSDAFSYREDYMWASGLAEGNGKGTWGYSKIGVVDSVNKTIRYSFVNTPVLDLYKFAWWGLAPKYWTTRYNYDGAKSSGKAYQGVPDNRILWKTNDPRFYLRPQMYDNSRELLYQDFDAWSMRNKFCVEFVFPLDRKEDIPALLMEGLNRYFSKELGVNARIETRKRPCLVLKKDESYRSLESKGGERQKERDTIRQADKLTNYAFEELVVNYIPYRIQYRLNDRFYSLISSRITPLNRNLPVIDETGITGNVDMTLYDVKNDVRDPVEAINKRLKGTGLYVEKAVREMEMLVISDEVNP